MGGAFPNKLNPGQAGPLSTTKPGVPMVVDYVEVKYAGGQGGPTDPTTPPVTTPPVTSPPSTPPPVTNHRHRPPTDPTDRHRTVEPAGHRRPPAAASRSAGTARRPAATRSCAPVSGSPTVTGQSFTDIGLLPNTPYLYSVRGNGVTTPVLTATAGILADGEPDHDDPADHTTVQPPASGTPSNLRVTGTTPSTVTIGWDGPGRRQLSGAAVGHPDRDRHRDELHRHRPVPRHPVPVFGAVRRNDDAGADRDHSLGDRFSRIVVHRPVSAVRCTTIRTPMVIRSPVGRHRPGLPRRRTDGGPTDSRSCSVIGTRWVFGTRSSDSRISTARRPISKCGMATLVSCGRSQPARSESSNETIEMSCGTVSPAPDRPGRRRCATRSFRQMKALGRCPCAR